LPIFHTILGSPHTRAHHHRQDAQRTTDTVSPVGESRGTAVDYRPAQRRIDCVERTGAGC
jgi:hypothetical protein